MPVRSWHKTYHADVTHSMTSEVIELARRPDHVRGAQEMTMSTRPRPDASSSPPILRWLFDLVIRMVARSLNMPEPLVHSTGVLVFAQVQAIENRAAKTLSPIRLLRQLRSLLR
jgi:hypothetical protein